MRLRTTLLPLASLACVGCLGAGVYLLMSTPPSHPETVQVSQARGWLRGLDRLFRRHQGEWPGGARALIGLAAVLGLSTAVLRFERSDVRRSLSGSAAWLGVGIMLGLWAIAPPAAAPPWAASLWGLLGGIGLGLVSQPLLGWAGWSQGIRDSLLAGVLGFGVAWGVTPLFA